MLEKDRRCPSEPKCFECDGDESVACGLCRPAPRSGEAKLDGQRDLKTPHVFEGAFENRRCIKCRVQAHEPLSYRDCLGHPRTTIEIAESRRVQLMVTHTNEAVTFHPVPSSEGWKIDAGLGVIIVGKGMGRTYIPLCNVLTFSPQLY